MEIQGIDKNNYFAITFSWQIFGGGKSVATVSWRLKLWGAFVYVRVSANEYERGAVMSPSLCQPGKQMGSYFKVVWPTTVSQQKQSEHLCYALIISEIVTINKIFYILTKFYEKCFFTIRDLFLLLLQNTVPISCRRNSPPYSCMSRELLI